MIILKFKRHGKTQFYTKVFLLFGWFFIFQLNLLAQSGESENVITKERIINAIDKGCAYFASINIQGGYVYFYTLDLKEKWGEVKTDDHTIEVQPPGTPAVGMSFLTAYRATKNSSNLEAATNAARALLKGQNHLHGWDHRIHFDRPSTLVSFDDDQTQSAIRFLMALDVEIDDHDLNQGIDSALAMMLRSQMDHGGWPHVYPTQNNYHDFATFNDAGINDCIRVMIQAYQQYGRPEFLESLHLAGRFLMISQLPPPQPGWAQQYNQFLQPAWAREFEPPSVCPLVTVLNTHTLMDLYLLTGERKYLVSVRDPLRWLSETRLPNGRWGRFLELGTNKPLYYDRGRIRVSSTEELSEERRTGYGYEVDITASLSAAQDRFERIGSSDISEFPSLDPSRANKLDNEERKRLEKEVVQILANQDELGRWVSYQDRFKVSEPGKRWSGDYRLADRISSKVFNDHIATLCQYLNYLNGRDDIESKQRD